MPAGWSVRRMSHVAHDCGWTAAVPSDEPWRVREAMDGHAAAGCQTQPRDTPEG